MLFVFFFMSAVASTGCGCGVRWSKWLRTLISKNVFSKWPPQKPSAAMSDLAPMSVMVEASLKVSLVTGIATVFMYYAMRVCTRAEYWPAFVFSKRLTCRLQNRVHVHICR